MKEKNLNKRHFRGDMIFISAILLLAALGAVYLFFLRPGGNMVKVTIDGKLYATYKLSEEIVEDIKSGDKGKNLNRLVIKDGKATIEEASCPDGICSSHSPIFRDGESIVCLPNKVVVTVITDKTDDSPDIVIQEERK